MCFRLVGFQFPFVRNIDSCPVYIITLGVNGAAIVEPLSNIVEFIALAHCHFIYGASVTISEDCKILMNADNRAVNLTDLRSYWYMCIISSIS